MREIAIRLSNQQTSLNRS